MKRYAISITAAIIMAVVLTAFAGCFQILSPNADVKIDLSQLSLVFEDNFDEFDSEVWWSGDDGIRRGGYWDIDQVEVKDGNMIITTQYLEDGKFGKGWYTGSVYTKGKKEFKSGYAEARCILPKGSGLWGAFWLQSPNMAAEGGGAEIDVVEGPYYNDPYNSSKLKNTVFHTLHTGGYGDGHIALQSPYYKVSNIYDEFHTYGVRWDENGYTFYVDGMQTWQTKEMTTTDNEFLWLSVEIAGEYGTADPSNPKNKYTWAGEIERNGKDFVSTFVIDYVKVYALN